MCVWAGTTRVRGGGVVLCGWMVGSGGSGGDLILCVVCTEEAGGCAGGFEVGRGEREKVLEVFVGLEFGVVLVQYMA